MTPAEATAASTAPNWATAVSTASAMSWRAARVADEAEHPPGVSRDDGVEVGGRRHRVADALDVAAAIDREHVPPRGDQRVDRGRPDAPGGAGHERDGAHRASPSATSTCPQRSAVIEAKSRAPLLDGRAGRVAEHAARRHRGDPVVAQRPEQLAQRCRDADHEPHCAARARGASASTSDVSVLPACASPPREPRCEDDDVVALVRRGRRHDPERLGVAPVGRDDHDRAAPSHAPSGRARSTMRASASVPTESVPANPACSPLAPTPTRRGDDDVVAMRARARRRAPTATNVSVDSGRCGPCCSHEPSGTARTWSAPLAASSVQVRAPSVAPSSPRLTWRPTRRPRTSCGRGAAVTRGGRPGAPRRRRGRGRSRGPGRRAAGP